MLEPGVLQQFLPALASRWRFVALCQGLSPLELQDIRPTCWVVVTWKQKQAAGPHRLHLVKGLKNRGSGTDPGL